MHLILYRISFQPLSLSSFKCYSPLRLSFTFQSSSSNLGFMAVGSGSSTTSDSSSSSGKKARKPYTITKSRESWSDEEHDKFLEALHLFGRDWKRIEDYVSSKTVIQIRSHAQKYFLKIQKNGAMAHVPPPRPKRKAADPYKTIKNAVIHRPTLSCVAAGLSQWDESVIPLNIASNGRMCSQDEYTNFNVFEDSTDIASESVVSFGNSSFNGRGSSCLTPPNLAMPKRGSLRNVAGMPDFAVIYMFIGSVFDPDTKDHLRELKEMDPINLRTVLLMMRNLTINISSTACETIGDAHPSYDANGEDQDTRGVITTYNNSYYVPSVSKYSS